MIDLLHLYYIMLAACFILAQFYLQHKKVKLLSLLLFLSIITELGVEILKAKGQNYFILYHWFTIPEYALITLILRDGIPVKPVQKIMVYTIGAFTVLCLLILLNGTNYLRFPAVANTTEGVLIIIFSITAVWTIDASGEESIFKKPPFWFAISFLIYFAGSIFYNGIYNSLLHQKTGMAKSLFTVINSCCNFLLYFLLIIGILHYKWKKYT